MVRMEHKELVVLPEHKEIMAHKAELEHREQLERKEQ